MNEMVEEDRPKRGAGGTLTVVLRGPSFTIIIRQLNHIS